MVATERTQCTYILSYRDAHLDDARSGAVEAIPPGQMRGMRSRFAGFDTAAAPGFAGRDGLRRGVGSDRGRERRHRRGSPAWLPADGAASVSIAATSCGSCRDGARRGGEVRAATTMARASRARPAAGESSAPTVRGEPLRLQFGLSD